MTKTILSFLAFLAFSIISCNQTKEPQEHSEVIELNQGKKWKVVPEMLGIIRTMESDIQAYSDTSDFNILSRALSSNVDSLTTNCTMDGKAHDELHKWLLPYIDLVNDTKKANSKDKQRQILGRFESSLKTFNAYFE